VEGAANMAILSQLVPLNVLAKMSELHVSLLNASLEAEIVHNAAIKQALSGKTAEFLKSIGH
jgi:hypothetical protein